MASLGYEELLAACNPGGSSVLSSVTELAPAGGEHTSVAPAKFVDGDNSVFAYERRFIDGEPLQTAVIDSKQSQLNRGEVTIQQAIDDGHPLLGRVPLVQVVYGSGGGTRVFTDLQLPHRAWDGHVRAGTVDGKPATSNPTYRAARDATPANAKKLLEFSPGSLVFGSWDSTRRSNQSRYRSALVGEIIGVLAEQDDRPPRSPRRGGARVDPVAMSVQLSGADLEELVKAQEAELSPKLAEKIRKGAKGRGEKAGSASQLGLGGIPPSLTALGGVACRRIIRSHVLSFAALRQLRFGAGPDGDAAARALLAAYALAGLARSEAELYLRANCDLVEKEHPRVILDERWGESRQLQPLSIESADEMLAMAIDGAEHRAGVEWSGQRFVVQGNPVVLAAATSDDATT